MHRTKSYSVMMLFMLLTSCSLFSASASASRIVLGELFFMIITDLFPPNKLDKESMCFLILLACLFSPNQLHKESICFLILLACFFPPNQLDKESMCFLILLACVFPPNQLNKESMCFLILLACLFPPNQIQNGADVPVLIFCGLFCLCLCLKSVCFIFTKSDGSKNKDFCLMDLKS